MKRVAVLDEMANPGVLLAMLMAHKMRIRRPPVEFNSTGPAVISVAPPAAPKATVLSGASRNDPCPCGSGKKRKHCCGAGKTGG